MDAEKRRLAGLLAKRFFVRFHLSLILLFSFAAGLLTTRVLLALGVETLLWRWPLAAFGAYAGFFLGVRLWLTWIGLGRVLDRDDGADVSDAGDILDFVPSGNGSSGGGLSLPDAPVPEVPAGGFGGGGASADFAASEGDSLLPDADLPDVDLGGGDDGCMVVVLLVLVAALLAAALGVTVYMIWQAPLVLAEAAFEAAVAAGMIRSVHRFRDPGWFDGAVRASWKPFLAVLAMMAFVAGAIGHYLPQARTLLEAVRMLRDAL